MARLPEQQKVPGGDSGDLPSCVTAPRKPTTAPNRRRFGIFLLVRAGTH
ncbi:hypothetical protein Rhow_005816 [Rhodococcus wratislaviensis]|uniref:Uncharacterized protein n=1 Tax=Rhodococcus wratislaviensis TaxID=44752 RepID=A0A402BZP1_RHOWR|nr:hypothetical protein Rhow_005816 [Rhodococcus wratislaviensis]